MKTIRNTLKHLFTGRLYTLSRNIAANDPSPCRQGHFRSWKVTSSFLTITFDRDQLEQWNHHRCVQDGHTDRLICNMTFRDQVMTLPEVKFQNDLLRSNYSSFDVSQDQKYNAGKMNATSILSQKLLQQTFIAKTAIFKFLLSGGQTVDLRSNLSTSWRKRVKRAIECVFRGRCSSSSSRVMCRFVEKYW